MKLKLVIPILLALWIPLLIAATDNPIHDWFEENSTCRTNCGQGGSTWIVVLIVVFGLMTLLLLGLALLSRRGERTAERLRRTGKHAPALVMSVEDTGMTINQNPRVRLHLRVMPPGEPEFEVEKAMTVSRLGIPQAGMTIGVSYDPDDPEDLILDAGAPGAATAQPGAAAQDPAALEAAVRQALAARGVTGELQERAVRQALAAAASGAAVVDLREYTQPGGAAPADPLERLKTLAELRDSGALTPAEFELQKAKLLAEL